MSEAMGTPGMAHPCQSASHTGSQRKPQLCDRSLYPHLLCHRLLPLYRSARRQSDHRCCPLFPGIAYGCDDVGVMIGDSNVLLIIGGYAGLVSAVIAAYLSAAIVINSSLRRAALPIFPAMPTR